MSRNEAVSTQTVSSYATKRVLMTMFAGVAAAHKQDADCLAHKGQRPSALRDWFHRAQEELSEL
jgi:hypothetical protein